TVAASIDYNGFIDCLISWVGCEAQTTENTCKTESVRNATCAWCEKCGECK
ncbi:hypothetical protein EWB00_005578, partial [Schistosoma japonicum]